MLTLMSLSKEVKKPFKSRAEPRSWVGVPEEVLDWNWRLGHGVRSEFLQNLDPYNDHAFSEADRTTLITEVEVLLDAARHRRIPGLPRSEWPRPRSGDRVFLEGAKGVGTWAQEVLALLRAVERTSHRVWAVGD